MEQKVLSYGDVLLRSSDLEILRSPTAFLNDLIIEFYLAHLLDSAERERERERERDRERERERDRERHRHAEGEDAQEHPIKDAVLLLPPATSFWIARCPDVSDTLRDSLDPLLLPRRELVMFVVNDNEDVDAAGGGQHWSLLVYYRELNKFEHYDSMAGMNAKEAKMLASTIKKFLGSNGSSAQFEEAWTPQQQNGYDCGLYVMAITEILLQAYTRGLIGSIKCRGLLQEKITAQNMSQMRGNVLNTILTLANFQKSA